MQSDDGVNQEIPVLADLSPRALLTVDQGTQLKRPIACRRVVTLFGSKQGCKVVLPHKHVAPVHAALVNTGSGIIAVDLVTRHGTKLNGLKLAYESLTDGDVLSISQWEFLASVSQPKPPDDLDAHPFELDQTPRAVALEHIDSGRVLGLTREVSIIGRRRGCDVCLEDPLVSRTHAIILMYFGYPAVCDLLSENGTLVNDQSVAFQRLQEDDVLTFGESSFRVRLIVSGVGGAKKAEPDSPPNDDAHVDDVDDSDTDAEGSDMIDIEETESSQTWRIADKLKRAAGEG